MTRRLSLACAFLATFMASRMVAADGDPTVSEPWPQFRGPGAQGHVTANIPTVWSDTLNKVWEVGIPGKGWSSPVIAEGKIWMTTAVPANNGAFTFRALAVDAQDGKIIHDIDLFDVAKPATLHARNSLATPSPIVSKG